MTASEIKQLIQAEHAAEPDYTNFYGLDPVQYLMEPVLRRYSDAIDQT